MLKKNSKQRRHHGEGTSKRTAMKAYVCNINDINLAWRHVA